MQADDVARRFAAKYPLALTQLGHNIPIPDIGPHKFDTTRLHRQLKPEIGHQGANQSAPQQAALMQAPCA